MLRRFSLVGCGLIAWATFLAAPVSAAAAAAEAEFARLKQEFDRQLAARSYAEAGKTADALCRMADESLQGKPDAVGSAVSRKAMALHSQGQVADAERLYKQALASWEQARGPDDAALAPILYWLGRLYAAQDRLPEAVAACERGLAIREKTQGPESPIVAELLCDLANLYKRSGRSQHAERLYQRSLSIAEKNLGREHIGVAACLQNLASLYSDQQRYAEAEPLCQRSMAIYEKQFGAEHPKIADGLTILGGVRKGQGRWAEAEEALQRALEIRTEQLGADHADVAASLTNLGMLYGQQSRWEEAEKFFQQALASREKALGREHPIVADVLVNLAWVHQQAGRYAEAEPLYQRALAIGEKTVGPEHVGVASCLNNLADLYTDQGRYAEAEPLCERALEICRKQLGPKHLQMAQILTTQGALLERQARYADAEPLLQQALDIRQERLGPGHSEVAASLTNLATVLKDQGRNDEAENLFRRALAIQEKTLGPEHPDLAITLNNLGLLVARLGRYDEAEAFLQRALTIRTKVLGSAHPDAAGSLINLAHLAGTQGRYAEAEKRYKQAIELLEKTLGREHPQTAETLSGLGSLYNDLGRYVEAESLQKEALAIREKVLGPEHPDVASSLNNLATLYYAQSRYEEAAALFARCVPIARKNYGPDHLAVATLANNVGGLAHTMQLYAESEDLHREALAIREKALGKDHPDVADSLNNLGTLSHDQQRYDEELQFHQQALAIREKAFGRDSPVVASSLNNLAEAYRVTDRPADAEPLIERALRILDRQDVDPDLKQKCYRLRAKLRWQSDRRPEALDDLGRALDLAEQMRGRSSGSEHQRAAFFGSFASVYEQMVHWRTELSQPAEVLETMERSRCRSLVDQMAIQGVDLLAGLPADQADKLREAERAAQQRVAELTRQLQQLAARQDVSREDRQVRQGQLETQLAEAQQHYVAAYADVRNASPAYRLAVGQDLRPVPLDRLQHWAAERETLVLQYLLGFDGGYVLVVPGGGPARVERITVSQEVSSGLGVEAGPLTAARLAGALNNAGGTGVLQRLRAATTPEKTREVTPALAALWQVLIPQPERSAIIDGKFKRLTIIPDSSLAQLPFETLVIGSPEQPRYLLDSRLPTGYAPSATVLLNLAGQSAAKAAQSTKPVLTVGNPQYPQRTAGGAGGLLGQLAMRSSSVLRDGSLPLLPHTEWETDWVQKAFGEHGIRAVQLKGDEATKAAVLSQSPGHRILHLACHGLADQAYGNLFGALAFTPGASRDGVEDDGLLMTRDIYGLNLRGCELTILSACDTNAGPEQLGEGVWALSRGFLVAGSRRVVASNWLVDDEAAASLVSYFCGLVARSEEQGKPADFVQLLHDAKTWVRQQEKWTGPYYWGTFVLVGAP